MAKVQFSRAQPFIIGDLIVQIFVDGEKAGSLIGKKPLMLDLAPGAHTIQARMFGQKGSAIVLQVGQQELSVAVSGTRQMQLPGWLVALWVLGCCVPGGNLKWELIRWSLTLTICLAISYRWSKFRPNMLQLSVSEGITSGSPASSKPLSSPR